MKQYTIAIFISVLILQTAFAQQQTQTANDYYVAANDAYKQKDYHSYVANLEKTIAAGARHPRIYYQLAGGYALLGKTAESLATLRKLAQFGLSFKPEEDPDFASLKSNADFNTVLTSFRQNLKPFNRAQVAFEVPDQSFIAEAVTYDPVTKTFYAGSIRKGKIVSINRENKVQDFATGLWCVLGMSVDAKRRILWAAAEASEDAIGFNPEDKNRSGLYKFDLQTGKLVARYVIPDNTKQHVLGDVIVNQNGDAFATDSITPAIYRIRNGADRLEVFAGPEAFRSPQGLALSADEKTLFVADYVRGIFAFSLADGTYRRLESPPDKTVVGIDGLYRYKNDLIATQNGVEPNRVIRLALSPDQTSITDVVVLEANHAKMDEPTLGVVVDDSLYFVANSQYGKFLENREATLLPPVILKLPLNH